MSLCVLTFSLFIIVIVRPELKSRYKRRVSAALAYAKTIDDFVDLIDPWNFYRFCLGPESSPFILRALAKEKKSMFLLV